MSEFSAFDATKSDGKPCACRWCGSTQVGVQHIEHRVEFAPTQRWAQVRCRGCDSRGPLVRFELSDEWPHIQAEKIAVAKWDVMNESRGN